MEMLRAYFLMAQKFFESKLVHIISRLARWREIIICTMCVRTCVREGACVCHAVSSETTTVTHFW